MPCASFCRLGIKLDWLVGPLNVRNSQYGSIRSHSVTRNSEQADIVSNGVACLAQTLRAMGKLISF